MKAIVITRAGGPEVLELREVPTPEPAPGEVRVRVSASAVNRADLLQRMGVYPAPADVPADIPGLEFSGTVDALGRGVTDFSVGDRVMGLVGGGAYGEYLVTHARTVSRLPEGLSFSQAAAMPEAFITAYDAMVTQARLSAGETVLVSAVGSGVGTAAVQIARAIGATSIGTARTEAKLKRARELGMDEGLHVSGPDFAAQVKRLTRGTGFHVGLELVGGAYVNEDIACAAPRGRIVLVGLLAGATAELSLGAILAKRLQLIGTMLRSRPLEEKIAAAQLFSRHLAPLIATGELKPVIDRTFTLAEAAAAHTYVASNDGFGKVVLEVLPD